MSEKPHGGPKTRKITSIGKSFQIIEAVEELSTPTLTEIANHTGIPVSTAHLYLETLVYEGYLSKKDDQYVTTLRFLRLGSAARRECKVYRIAKGILGDLADETDELASLGVEQNGLRVLLYKSESPQAIYDDAPIGEFTNMHWTALGKAILSQLPKDEVTEIIDMHGLPKATERTITDKAELYDELGDIAKQGHAIEDEERREGIMSVSTPIVIKEQRRPVGAISVTGPQTRIKTALDDIIERLNNKKNIIEVKFVHDKNL